MKKIVIILLSFLLVGCAFHTGISADCIYCSHGYHTITTKKFGSIVDKYTYETTYAIFKLDNGEYWYFEKMNYIEPEKKYYIEKFDDVSYIIRDNDTREVESYANQAIEIVSNSDFWFEFFDGSGNIDVKTIELKWPSQIIILDTSLMI